MTCSAERIFERRGETEFHVTKETIEHFQEMEAHQFDDATDEDRTLCHGLFGDEDDTKNEFNMSLLRQSWLWAFLHSQSNHEA